MPHLATAVCVVSPRPSGRRKTEAPGVRPASPGRPTFAPCPRGPAAGPEPRVPGVPHAIRGLPPRGRRGKPGNQSTWRRPRRRGAAFGPTPPGQSVAAAARAGVTGPGGCLQKAAPGARRLYEGPEASGCPPDASGFVETRLAYFELTETIVASANEYSSA